MLQFFIQTASVILIIIRCIVPAESGHYCNSFPQLLSYRLKDLGATQRLLRENFLDSQSLYLHHTKSCI